MRHDSRDTEIGPDHWAHTRVDPETGRVLDVHPLQHHLDEVARLAGGFADPFGGRWAEIAGRWHDLGKFRPGFQSYIRQDTDAHIEGRPSTSRDKTHSAAGALHALDTFAARWGHDGGIAARLLAYVIAGHHAGLADWTAGLDARLLGTGREDSRREHSESVEACAAVAPSILGLPADFDIRNAIAAIPGLRERHLLAASFWTRMVFSALVDADFLDTEAFMDRERAIRRADFPPVAWYAERLDTHLDARRAQLIDRGLADQPVMSARADVLRQCRDKSVLPPGVFTLTVPTGGGKTQSSLAFALRHALAHGKRRVVYAIPYTSIIEQTVDDFGAIFGRDHVVEHHSQADADPRAETAASRLACENWDAPLVVTTNVQFFESLFAARTSRCRKLHNLCNSVIVLDEAQLLPPEFLQPVLDALHLLVAGYGATLLLCTATQPTLTDARRFDPRQSIRGLPEPVPLIDDVGALYRTLDRVRIEWPDDVHAERAIDSLAEELAREPAVLAIVNTRRDAAALMKAVDAATGERTIHLSAAMCGQHRADVIREIRERLESRRRGGDAQPIRVVSTQLVEAGVDLDFPVVFRAFAGLDSIAQAAGRCNREGKLPSPGRVVVFVRGLPKSLPSLRIGAQATRSVLRADRAANRPSISM